MRTERKRALRRTFLGICCLGLILGFWAFLAEPSSLRVREHRVAIPGVAGGRSGMRIALLSDLHVGSPDNGLDKLAEVVRRTNAARPDLVLILGDLVIQDVAGGRFVPPEKIAPVLGRSAGAAGHPRGAGQSRPVARCAAGPRRSQRQASR